MAELSSEGALPDRAIDFTYREIHWILDGAQRRRTRELQVAMFGAWQNEALHRTKRMPKLEQMLRKLEPVRIMSAKALRAAVLGMARAMGAEVRHVKRGEQ